MRPRARPARNGDALAAGVPPCKYRLSFRAVRPGAAAGVSRLMNPISRLTPAARQQPGGNERWRPPPYWPSIRARPAPARWCTTRPAAPRRRLPRADAALPAAGLGGTRRRGNLGVGARSGPASAGPGGRRSAAADRDRPHEPARDGGAVGAGRRPAGRPGDRLAGPPHRRLLPRAPGRRAVDRRTHRPGTRPVLFRDQNPLAAGSGRAAARPRPASWRAARSTAS